VDRYSKTHIRCKSKSKNEKTKSAKKLNQSLSYHEKGGEKSFRQSRGYRSTQKSPLRASHSSAFSMKEASPVRSFRPASSFASRYDLAAS
jgi:hypothetical protein